MSDDELKSMVQHLAKLHGVTPEHIVAEAMGDEGSAEAGADANGPGGATRAAADEEDVEDEPVPKTRGGAHWAGWVSAMVVMGVLVGAGVIGVIRFFNAPAQAAIKPTLNGVPAATPVPKGPTTNLLNTLVVSFTYPGVFDQVTRVKNDPAADEQYNLTSKSDYHRTITVETLPFAGETLTDNSSYRVRQIHPATYTPDTERIEGETVTFMTNVNGQEVVMFWPHGNNLLIVAVTSNDPNDHVGAFMDVIKSDVRWHP